MPIKVAIVDDHPLAISGIKALLTPYPNIVIINTYNSGLALMDGLTQHQPEVLLLDIFLPDKSGRELAPLIVKMYPDIRIIALTSIDAPNMIKNMMQHGCLGYLLKNTDHKTLVQAIQSVYKREEFIEPSLKEHLMEYMFKNLKHEQDMQELTPREKEVLQLIVAEYTTQEIADKLFISFRTAETHRYSLLQKLGCKNVAGLVKMAIQLGLVE